jgi:glutathione synthase/RimK-type ligase-like ATP-grasp enzyme
MRRILVTGAGGSAASNFVRSLRLADDDFHVVGVDSSPYHLELSPVEERYLVPRANAPDYLDALNQIVEREEIEFVHPQPDPEVLELARRRGELRAATFLPATETVELCQDKAASAARLADAGLPAPEAFKVESEESLRQATDTIVEGHGKAWVRALRGAGGRASLPVTTGEQAVSWVRYWVEVRGMSVADFMVSQFLPGREYAFQSLWRDGELVTSQARERLQYLYGHLTPSGQTSTPSVATTVHRDDLNELAAACIRAVDPRATGVFCVDLKEDAGGQPLLTEINAGRFFTTSNFLAEAGSNMPYHSVRLGLGEDVDDLPRFNAVEADLYWVRMVDMGFKLVREGEWTSSRLS